MYIYAVQITSPISRHGFTQQYALQGINTKAARETASKTSNNLLINVSSLTFFAAATNYVYQASKNQSLTTPFFSAACAVSSLFIFLYVITHYFHAATNQKVHMHGCPENYSFNKKDIIGSLLGRHSLDEKQKNMNMTNYKITRFLQSRYFILNKDSLQRAKKYVGPLFYEKAFSENPSWQPDENSDPITVFVLSHQSPEIVFNQGLIASPNTPLTVFEDFYEALDAQQQLLLPLAPSEPHLAFRM